MKIVFMGTPEFARRALEYLHNNTRHGILAVVTGPDMPAGRGRKVVATAVKHAADQFSLPVYTPASLKDRSFTERMRNTGADIFVVVAFRILPGELSNRLPVRGLAGKACCGLPDNRHKNTTDREFAFCDSKLNVDFSTCLVHNDGVPIRLPNQDPYRFTCRHTAGI